MRRFFYFFLPLLLALTACGMTQHLEKKPDLEEVSRNFTRAMRWQDYYGASKFMQEELRKEFLAQFKDDDLHVVESVILYVEQKEDAETASIEYSLSYYRLPSNRVKKWQWQQQWQLVQPEEDKVPVWLIQNAPPAFP